MESKEQPGYLSYLLRLWQAETGRNHREEGTVWRGSLESALTGERLGFADLEELFGFLRLQTGALAEFDEEQNQ